MFARYYRTVLLGLKSLWLQKLRSGLTMLGIVFGVFSVIAMLAIGEGASNQAQRQIVELGATNIIVRSVKPIEESSSNQNMRGTPRYGLTRADYDRIMLTIPSIRKALPIREIPREARYQRLAINARLVGCTADYLEVNHLRLRGGRFISDADNDALANYVVLASEIAEKLFPLENPLGKSIQVGSIFYTVIGITAERTASAGIGGSLSAQDFNKDLYIPIKTLRVRIGDEVFTPKAGGMDSERVELNQITLSVHDIEEVMRTADLVQTTVAKFHTQKDFAVVVPLELKRQADQLRQIFNIVLGSIAAISLVVGGIGIMNIMLATVTERTREIGIRRALGAKQSDIIEQFLAETIVLSGMGGIVGVLLGLSTPWAFSLMRWLASFATDTSVSSGAMSDTARIFNDMQPQIAWGSLPLAFGISVGIGVIFGLYPASAAARLDPIEALRHE